MRELNNATIKLIRDFEGESLTAYKDPIGLLTVGVGHLVKRGESYKLGQKITKDESKRLLRQDLKIAQGAVERLVKVPLTDNQYGALVSFTFNLGEGNLKKSTLLRKLNTENYMAAANEFPRWNIAGDKILKGLTRRRKAERELFLKDAPQPKYGDTLEFVKAFQRVHGLTVDGIPGPKTYGALMEVA